MRETFKHAGRIEIPYGRPTHHVHAKWAEDSKVCCGIDLFHKAILFLARLYAVPSGQGPVNLLHEEFAREGKDDDVESNKGEI